MVGWLVGWYLTAFQHSKAISCPAEIKVGERVLFKKLKISFRGID